MLPSHWIDPLNFLSNVKHRWRWTAKWKKSDSWVIWDTSHTAKYTCFMPLSPVLILFLALWSRTSAIWFLKGSTACLIVLTPCQHKGHVVCLWCLPRCPERIFTLPPLAMSDNHIPTHLGENSRQPMPTVSQVLEHFARLLLPILNGRNGKIVKNSCFVVPNWTSSDKLRDF